MTSSSDTRDAPHINGDTTERNRIAPLTGLLLLYKIAFFAVVWGLTRWMPSYYSLASYELHSRGSATSRAAALPTEGLWRYFETWDAHHYLHLARFGYGDQPMSLAFYPLWPFLIRVTAPLFGGNFTLAALVLANAFSLVALVLLHRLVARRFDESIATRTLVLMLAFPGALFLCFPYTESLFFLLCVALFWLLDSARIRATPTQTPVETTVEKLTMPDNWQLVGGVAALAAGAAFARPTGLFLVIPLALFAWMRRDNPLWRVVALAPVIGVMGYFATMYFSTGDVAAGLKAQQLFAAKPSIIKLFDVPNFVRGFLDISPARGGRGFIYDRVWFVLFCSTLWPLWKRDKLWFAFAIVMGMMTAFGAAMMSFMRYFSIIFPCFFIIANWFAGPRIRMAFPIALAVLFLLQIYFLVLHINYYWVS